MGETAGTATRRATRTLTRAGAAPPLGTNRTGLGGLLIYATASILGLALLDTLLRGRGPVGVDVALRGLGGGIRKLVDPHDPLLGPGPPPSPSASSSAAGSSSSGGSGPGTATGAQGLTPAFASSLERLLEASQGKVWVNSGFRSIEEQRTLFAAAVKKYGSVAAARKWVAPPGASNHNKGVAADLGGALDWAHQNASRFGLTFPMSWEPWHIEPIGARP